VRFAGWRAGYGRLVILDHGGSLTTWYAHASKILVRVGQRIAKGAIIALVGTSGEVTGPHVHFEVRRGNAPLDPWPYLNGRRLLREIKQPWQ
jgi:murein DD-endopeptidase MepM/ murein hydrolase activator NlpD